jgi:hypothetical protein
MAALDGLMIAGRETRPQPKTSPPRLRRWAMDWDDVRVFLAVAREGSMRAAGRALGLSQPTIARRLAAFEATFGGPTLFDRLLQTVKTGMAPHGGPRVRYRGCARPISAARPGSTKPIASWSSTAPRSPTPGCTDCWPRLRRSNIRLPYERTGKDN